MRNKLLLLLAGVSMMPAAYGKTLSPSEALARAGESASIPATRGSDTRLLHTFNTPDGNPGVYAFGSSLADGYLLVSADDVAAPVLGYSDSGKFDISDIPSQMSWWISEYGRQIEYANEKGAAPYVNISTRADREAIAPLISTIWNQMKPFNDDCPTIGNQKAPSGCVATAMAQVMKYWNYPVSGTGTGHVKLPESGDEDFMSFTKQKFDWDNMIDSYNGEYTEEQASAVAYLMKACGYSAQMSYNLSGSGAATIRAAMALINNFKYNPNLQYLSRDYFSPSDWEEMVYQELVEKRPLMYSGASTSVAHEFICDGYDGNGYFHFNWGWGGMSDGYFMLNSLNPGSVGTGGGDGGGFNFNQDVIMKIQPRATEDNHPQISQWGNLNIAVHGSSCTVSLDWKDGEYGWWINSGLQPVGVDIDMEMMPVDGTQGSGCYVTLRSGSLQAPTLKDTEAGTSISWGGIQGNITTSLPTELLSDGRYKLTIVCKKSGTSETNYKPVLASSDGYNYAYITKSGDTYKVENMGVPTVEIAGAEVLSPLYTECASRMSITMVNKSAKPLTKSFYPVLMKDEKRVMEADGITLNIESGDTVTREFVTTFFPVEGEEMPSEDTTFRLAWYDPGTSTYYAWNENVTLRVNDGEVKVDVRYLEVDGAVFVEGQLDNGKKAYNYKVYDKNNIPFNLALEGEKGYFGKTVYIAVFPNGGGAALKVEAFNQIPTLGPGEMCTLTLNLDFAEGKAGDVYSTGLYIIEDNAYKSIEDNDDAAVFFTIMKESGVEELTAEDSAVSLSIDPRGDVTASSEHGIARIEVYATDGRCVLKIEGNGATEVSAVLPEMTGGVYVVKATDSKGDAKSLKFAR